MKKVYSFCSVCGGKLKSIAGDNLECPKCGFVNFRNPRPTVTALVFHKNKLLLTRRLRDPFKGWWDLPGGYINRGEYPAGAVQRELWEETGLRPVLKNIFGIYPGTDSYRADKYHVLSIVYTASSSVSRLLAKDDVSESKWFSRKDLPKKIAFDSNRNIIKDLLKVWK
ncbi:MAG: NUDIX hydrolase [Patescibacteria group bacterium]